MKVELLAIVALAALTGSTSAISGWTIWFDLNDPSAGHDSELLADIYGLHPDKVRPSPLLIQAETTAGVPALDTNQVLRTLTADRGLECYDSDQPGYPFSKPCEDYKVRFFCEEDCSTPCPGGTPDTDCTVCQCDNHILTGKVMNIKNIPLEGVSVSLANKPFNTLTVTNSTGQFSISGICSNGVEFVFQKNGYETTHGTSQQTQPTESYVHVTLNFFSPPVMTSHPSSTTRLVGESVTLCCSANGTPRPYSYRWFKNGNVLPTTVADNATLILDHLTTPDAGEYKCRASSDAGAVYSRPATLTIYDDASQQCDASGHHYVQLPREYLDPDSTGLFKVQIWSLDLQTGPWQFESDFVIDQSKKGSRNGQQFVFASTTITSTEVNLDSIADSNTICYIKVRTYNSRNYDKNDQADGVTVILITQRPDSPSFGRFETKVTTASKGACIPTQCRSDVNIFVKAEKDGKLFSVARNDELGFGIPDYETSPDGKSFKVNVPFPGSGSNGPMYRGDLFCGSGQCENSLSTDNHFKFYTNAQLFEFDAQSAQSCTDSPHYLCWYSEQSFYKKTCYIKVQLTGTGLEGTSVTAHSKVGTHKTAQPSIHGQLYGIREDVALPNDPDSPNTKAVCIEYKCSGQIWTTDSAGIPVSDPITDTDYTLVEVSVTPGLGATNCVAQAPNPLFQSTQSILQGLVDPGDWPSSNQIHNTKFTFLADETSTGHFFGIYHGNGAGEVGKTEAYEKCLHGNGGMSQDMNPDVGHVITFNCL